jgi:hypothetical protein
MANDPKDPKEIVSLNKELMSFDVGDMGIEELERRLELAIAQVGIVGADCGIDCGSDCGIRCGIRCGIDCGSDSILIES